MHVVLLHSNGACRIITNKNTYIHTTVTKCLFVYCSVLDFMRIVILTVPLINYNDFKALKNGTEQVF